MIDTANLCATTSEGGSDALGVTPVTPFVPRDVSPEALTRVLDTSTATIVQGLPRDDTARDPVTAPYPLGPTWQQTPFGDLVVNSFGDPTDCSPEIRR